MESMDISKVIFASRGIFLPCDVKDKREKTNLRRCRPKRYFAIVRNHVATVGNSQGWKAAHRVSFGAGCPANVQADAPGDVRGQKLRSGPRNPGKTSISVRTYMRRRHGRPCPQGGSKNFGQKIFGLSFRSQNSLQIPTEEARNTRRAKGPGRTKFTTRSKCTTCSEFLRWDWKRKAYTALLQWGTFLCPQKIGGHRGKILVVDMVLLVFIDFYKPPAWKVFLWGQIFLHFYTKVELPLSTLQSGAKKTPS